VAIAISARRASPIRRFGLRGIAPVASVVRDDEQTWVIALGIICRLSDGRLVIIEPDGNPHAHPLSGRHSTV
jgi:hypothetical protein